MAMDIENLTEQQRKDILENHPIFTKQYVIVTPVIEKVYAIIRERVYMRTTGTFMYATPRMGKSTCVKAIKLLLEAEFPKIFVMSFIAEPKKKQVASMLIDILQSEKLSIMRNGRYKDIQRQLFTHIQSEIAMRNGQQFILMIDELQNLCEDELIDLTAIHNRLETLGIKMTTLGFAQPEILNMRTMFMSTNQTFLIARFLCEPIPFDGCSTNDDLKKILCAYDNEQHYPEGSDYTFTRFFFPCAYANGFRLEQYSKPIWSALINAAKGFHAGSIPMEHVSRTIEFLLMLGQKEDCSSFKFNAKNIVTAVKASNLSYFTGLMHSTATE